VYEVMRPVVYVCVFVSTECDGHSRKNQDKRILKCQNIFKT